MQTHYITTYDFYELSDSAKEKAISNYRFNYPDYDWWDYIYNDAKQIGQLMGIEIENIHFRGFSHQGDGASFTGAYGYEKESVKRIKEYAPDDAKLHNIAARLFELQKPLFYQLSASITQSGMYVHSRTMRLSTGYEYEEYESELLDILREFADWIYDSLKEEYEYLTSNEQITETLIANGYQFLENGDLY